MYNPNQGQGQPGQAYNPQQQQFYQEGQPGGNGSSQQWQQQQQQFDPNALSQQLQNQHIASPTLPNATLATSGVNGGAGQRPRTAGSLGGGSRDDDYVMIQRNTDSFSQITKERAVATKLKVELFYKQNVQHALERNQR